MAVDPRAAGRPEFQWGTQDDGTYYRPPRGLSGRVAPRQQVRANRMDQILAAKGLVSSGDITPGQGQLFETGDVPGVSFSDNQGGAWTRSAADMLEAGGLPADLPHGARAGFLPDMIGTDAQHRAFSEKGRGEPVVLGDNTVRMDPDRAAKVKAVQKTRGRLEEIDDPGAATPTRTIMEHRSAYFDPNRVDDWYSHQAPDMTGEMARKVGTDYPTARTAVAMTSPQTPWDAGEAQEGTFNWPNIRKAGQVLSGTAEAEARALAAGQTFSAAQAFDRVFVPGETGGQPDPTKPKVHPKDRSSTTKVAALVTGEASPTDPYPGNAGKTPSFNYALDSANPSLAVRRLATQAYTSDTWDVETMGLVTGAPNPGPGSKERGYNQFVGAQHANEAGQPTVHGYGMAAMTGRRAAMRAGRTPSEYQENVWNGARPPRTPKRPIVKLPPARQRRRR